MGYPPDAEKLVPRQALDEMFTPFRGGYAYGWHVSKRHDRKCISHAGGINGFSTVIMRYPEDRACVIVLSNMMSANARRVGLSLSALLFGKEARFPQKRKPVQGEGKR